MAGARPYVQRSRAAAQADTRARILAATRELIPSAGATLPVAAIARHAGVATQTIYDQFGSKGGLLIAVVNDVQQSFGLFDAFREVFTSRDGEAAMRRMIEATISLWDRAWPYLAFLLRSRRIDPVVGREMTFIDTLRHAHFWAIVRRLDDEGRLRETADSAADHAFALTAPAIYEELVVLRRGSVDDVIATTIRAVLAVILDPAAPGIATGPPDWRALEAAAAERARAAGADPERLSADWQSATGTSRRP
jgi:AcrR family transcriptional regulator